MNYNEINDKVRETRIEDYIWIIYVGIIILSWYSNNLERDYFINNNLLSKEEYRKIIIVIFSILIVVYLYFLKDSIKSINSLKPDDSESKKFLTYLSFIGSLLIVISGIIFLYIALVDDSINVEIAFN